MTCAPVAVGGPASFGARGEAGEPGSAVRHDEIRSDFREKLARGNRCATVCTVYALNVFMYIYIYIIHIYSL